MAMGESWLISVIMRFTSNGARVMNEMAGATTRANAQLDSHNAKIARATAALEAYRLKMLQIGTTASGVIAVSGAAFAIAGVKMAADLQTAMLGVNVATMFKDPRGMRDLVLRTSGATAQSQVTIAQELQTLASAGFNRTSVLQSVFPQFAQAADVAWLMNPQHPDPVETVKQLAKFSHLLGVYSGPMLPRMVDSAIKLLYLQPDGLGQMTTSMRYFASRGRLAGVSMDQIFQQLMIMGQTGFLRGRGGSGIGMYTQRMMELQAGGLTKKQLKGAEELGLGTSGHAKFISIDPKTGKEVFDLMGSILYLGRMGKIMRGSTLSNALDKFAGVQASQAVATETLPQTRDQYLRSKEAFDKILGVHGQWLLLFHTLAYQWSRAVTNAKNTMIETWTPMLDTFSRLFYNLGNAFGSAADYLHGHPGDAKAFAELILTITGLAGARFMLGIAQIARLAFTMPAAVESVAASMDALVANLGKNAAIIRAEGLGLPILGPDGRVIGRGAGAVVGEGERAAETFGSRIARWLGTTTLMVTGMNIATVGTLGISAAVAAVLWGAHVNATGNYKKQYAWASGGGANRGMTAPQLSGDVDIFGHPIQHGFRANIPVGGAAFQSLEDAANALKTSATEVKKMPPNVNYNMPIYATVDPGVTPQQISDAVKGSLAALRSRQAANPSGTSGRVPSATRVLTPFDNVFFLKQYQ